MFMRITDILCLWLFYSYNIKSMHIWYDQITKIHVNALSKHKVLKDIYIQCIRILLGSAVPFLLEIKVLRTSELSFYGNARW